jgi:hypothetical protein
MQHMFREADVIPPLMHILDGFAADATGGSDGSAAAEHRMDDGFVLICRCVHKVLRHVVYDNLRNATYLAKHGHVNTMVTRLGLDLDAEQCLMEVLSNSRQMLTDFLHDNCSDSDDVLEKLIHCVHDSIALLYLVVLRVACMPCCAGAHERDRARRAGAAPLPLRLQADRHPSAPGGHMHANVLRHTTASGVFLDQQ